MSKVTEIQAILGVTPDGATLRLWVQNKTVLIDFGDYELFASHKWFVDTGGYVYRHRYINGEDHPVRLHREIMGEPKGSQVDHKNGNRLDNRRLNLRLCQQLQNSWNSKKKSNNKSGFKGVYYEKARGKFRAKIRAGLRRIELGRFNTSEEAHQAYCVAAKKYHGEFAKV